MSKRGNEIDPEGLRPLMPDDENLVAKACSLFREEGTDYLKPVFECLDGAMDYDTLRICRLYFLSRSQVSEMQR